MKAYLFDVDGVLTDPILKVVTEQDLFAEIILKLQKGNPICLNTGRSTKWLIERFINTFIEKINNKLILQKFTAIGEKGCTWIAFDENGKMLHGKRDDVSIPEEVLEQTKVLVKEKYSDSMFRS